MPAEKWRTRVTPRTPCGHSPQKLVLSGPALTEAFREQLSELAVSIVEGDERAEAWADYIAAVGALHAHGDPLSDSPDVEYLADRVSSAWDALAPDLCTELYLDRADVREVAQLLGDGEAEVVEPRGRVSRWLHVWRERVSV